jgi:hypothetical protein
MIVRPSRRDVIIRIGPDVRFAKLNATAIADAIWQRLPHYGVAGRTVDGALALALSLPAEVLQQTANSPGRNDRALVYCPVAQQIIFPLAALAATVSPLVLWAQLVEPFPSGTLVAVPQATRVALLHADS